MSDVARQVNELTRRWVQGLDLNRNQVVSGAGAWAVLGAALSGADGPARQELEQALGVTADRAAASVAELTRRLGAADGVAAALGLWTNERVRVSPAFVEALQPVHVGPLAGREALDAWVSEQTGGQLTRMPLQLGPGDAVLLVLAGVLAADARWQRPFDPVGPMRWFGEPDHVEALLRTDEDLQALTILGEAPGPQVSRVVLTTGGAFDVHLLGGADELTPNQVLDAGLGALVGSVRVSSPELLQPGQWAGRATCELRQVMDPQAQTELTIQVPAFDLAAEHDLLARPELFGLAAAGDATRGHFPGVDPGLPLAVSQAAQSAVARFSAGGFSAAAVTAVGMLMGGRPTNRIRSYIVDHDRPFGFLVVDRSDDLVLFAGWVVTPQAADRSRWISG